jgi:hypothetical protein
MWDEPGVVGIVVGWINKRGWKGDRVEERK